MTFAHSYTHRGGPEPLIGMTIDEYLRGVIARHGSRDAVVSVPQDRRVSYAALDTLVEEAARGLIGMGVSRGDRIGIWATDNLEWVVLQLATARVGAILVNVNPAYRISELRHALRLAEVQFLFLIPAFRSSAYIEMIAELVPEARDHDPEALASHLLPNLRRIVVWDPMDLDRRERWMRGMHTWAEFLEGGRSVSDAAMEERRDAVETDDPVNIQFTSGTTGFPKAVVLTHHNILNNGYFIGQEMGFTELDRLCVPLPFYHCFGMVVSNLCCLTHGACIVIPSGHFDAGAALRAIHTERCTAIHGVPTMFLAELDHPEFKSVDLSSLRTGIMAGAPCPPELMRRVMEDMGCREILIGYGQTEASPITNLTHREDSVDRRLSSVGKPMPHQECKVVDPATGRTNPIGVPGEVCFRGYHVMRGYYGQPEATAESIDEAHWLHSGDLGVMDKDGYIAITGRLKDMIIRGGENIYPAEIEACCYEHPAVAEIAVVGVPDAKYGEDVGAWIRVHEGARVSPDDIRTFVHARLAHYKKPNHIWFVSSFPMTVTGKIQKNRIREAVVRWIDAGGPHAPHAVEAYIR